MQKITLGLYAAKIFSCSPIHLWRRSRELSKNEIEACKEWNDNKNESLRNERSEREIPKWDKEYKPIKFIISVKV